MLSSTQIFVCREEENLEYFVCHQLNWDEATFNYSSVSNNPHKNPLWLYYRTGVTTNDFSVEAFTRILRVFLLQPRTTIGIDHWFRKPIPQPCFNFRLWGRIEEVAWHGGPRASHALLWDELLLSSLKIVPILEFMIQNFFLKMIDKSDNTTLAYFDSDLWLNVFRILLWAQQKGWMKHDKRYKLISFL